MFLQHGLGQLRQGIDSSEVYIPLLVPRESTTPAVTGANSLLAAAGLTAAGLGIGWLLKGPAGRLAGKSKRK